VVKFTKNELRLISDLGLEPHQHAAIVERCEAIIGSRPHARLKRKILGTPKRVRVDAIGDLSTLPRVQTVGAYALLNIVETYILRRPVVHLRTSKWWYLVNDEVVPDVQMALHELVDVCPYIAPACERLIGRIPFQPLVTKIEHPFTPKQIVNLRAMGYHPSTDAVHIDTRDLATVKSTLGID